jgi:hypothetical protein
LIPYHIRPYTIDISRDIRYANCGQERIYPSISYSLPTNCYNCNEFVIDTIQYKETYTYNILLKVAQKGFADEKAFRIYHAPPVVQAKNINIGVVGFDTIQVDFDTKNYYNKLPSTASYQYDGRFLYKKQTSTNWTVAQYWSAASNNQHISIKIPTSEAGIYEFKTLFRAGCTNTADTSAVFTYNKECAQAIRFDSNEYKFHRPYLFYDGAYNTKTQKYEYWGRAKIIIPVYMTKYFATKTNTDLNISILRRQAKDANYTPLFQGAAVLLEHFSLTETKYLQYTDSTGYDDDTVYYRIILQQPTVCGGNDTLNTSLLVKNITSNTDKIGLFPTLVRYGYTHINLPNPNASARAEFFNTLGQSVAIFENLTQYERMNIENLTSGFYMVFLEDSDGNKKMLKIEKW